MTKFFQTIVGAIILFVLGPPLLMEIVNAAIGRFSFFIHQLFLPSMITILILTGVLLYQRKKNKPVTGWKFVYYLFGFLFFNALFDHMWYQQITNLGDDLLQRWSPTAWHSLYSVLILSYLYAFRLVVEAGILPVVYAIVSRIVVPRSKIEPTVPVHQEPSSTPPVKKPPKPIRRSSHPSQEYRNSREEQEARAKQAEARVSEMLQLMMGDHGVVMDDLFLFPDQNNLERSHQIDHVVIIPFGILVVETKSRNHPYEYGKVDQDRHHTPEQQNYGHILALVEILKKEGWDQAVRDHIESVVVFDDYESSNRLRFELYDEQGHAQQAISRNHTYPTTTLRYSFLEQWLWNRKEEFQQAIFSMKEIREIESTIRKYWNRRYSASRMHLDNINRKYGNGTWKGRIDKRTGSKGKVSYRGNRTYLVKK